MVFNKLYTIFEKRNFSKVNNKNNKLKVPEIIVEKIPYLKKNNNKCCNKLTKKQFEMNNILLKNKDYNGLCVCCSNPIKIDKDKNILDCNKCPNGHAIHKSCKKYLEANLISNKICPICGLTINNKTCIIDLNKLGGKSKKKNTKKNKKTIKKRH